MNKLKQLKGIILLVFLMTAFSSCEGPEGPPGKNGDGMNWNILTFTVESQDWQLVGQAGDLNSYYMFEFKENDISDFIYREGKVSGYLMLGNGKNPELFPLPYSLPVGEVVGDNEEILWTEHYTFGYTPGYITFYVHYNDFQTGLQPPTRNFKIIMNW